VTFARASTRGEAKLSPSNWPAHAAATARKSRMASTVSLGSHSLNVLKAFSPAKTSNQATFRLLP